MTNSINPNISTDFWDIKGPRRYDYDKVPQVFPDDDNDDEDDRLQYDDGDDD